MLNKLLEQIQMMIGYQKSKKIGRFITLFFAISVGTYLLLALSLLILWLYGWGHMEDPFEMKEFLKIYFPAMSCVSGVIGAVFGLWLKDQSILGPFDPGIEATYLRQGENTLRISFPCVPRPFILYSIQLPRGWIFTSSGKSFLLVNCLIQFREQRNAPQELNFEVSSPQRLPADYCLPMDLLTALRSKPMQIEGVLK